MKYPLAVGVCIAELFAFVLIMVTVFGTEKIGFIPCLVLFAIWGATWAGIVNSSRTSEAKKTDSQSPDSAKIAEAETHNRTEA